jgi:nucleotide-binding universal stress UspA family protein
MFKVNKILCPVDFSEASNEVLKAANDLAVHFAAELLIVHVVQPVPTVSTPIQASTFNVVEYQKHLMDEQTKALAKVFKEHVSSELNTSKVLLEGQPADEILHIADNENVDLIVMATHGGSVLGHLLFGSVTDKVVRQSTHPVLTIRVTEK